MPRRPFASLLPDVSTGRARRLDRRNGQPRDYLVEPERFGFPLTVTACLPPGGDKQSAQVAWIQHEVCARLRSEAGRGPGHRLGERFGFSRQYWSLCMNGHAWMGETLLAAAISEILALPIPDLAP